MLAIARWDAAAAEASEREEVVSVIRLSLEHKDPPERESAAAVRRRLDDWLQLEGAEALIAKGLLNNRVEGVLMFREEPPDARILFVGVREARAGTGAKLVQMLQRIGATTPGGGWTALRASIDSADLAQRAFFLRTLGFHLEASRDDDGLQEAVRELPSVDRALAAAKRATGTPRSKPGGPGRPRTQRIRTEPIAPPSGRRRAVSAKTSGRQRKGRPAGEPASRRETIARLKGHLDRLGELIEGIRRDEDERLHDLEELERAFVVASFSASGAHDELERLRGEFAALAKPKRLVPAGDGAETLATAVADVVVASTEGGGDESAALDPMEQPTEFDRGRTRLRVLDGLSRGQVAVIGDDAAYKLGRGAEADVVVLGSDVSRSHCQVRWDGDALRLEDLGSRNGTTLEGEVVTDAVLHPGDTITVGSMRVRVESVPPGTPLETAPSERRAPAPSPGAAPSENEEITEKLLTDLASLRNVVVKLWKEEDQRFAAIGEIKEATAATRGAVRAELRRLEEAIDARRRAENQLVKELKNLKELRSKLRSERSARARAEKARDEAKTSVESERRRTQTMRAKFGKVQTMLEKRLAEEQRLRFEAEGDEQPQPQAPRPGPAPMTAPLEPLAGPPLLQDPGPSPFDDLPDFGDDEGLSRLDRL